MEEEAEKLKQLQSEVDKQMNMGSPPGISKFKSLFSRKYIKRKPDTLVTFKDILITYFSKPIKHVIGR